MRLLFGRSIGSSWYCAASSHCWAAAEWRLTGIFFRRPDAMRWCRRMSKAQPTVGKDGDQGISRAEAQAANSAHRR